MTIKNALRWVVLAGVFTLPFIVFIVTSSMFFPYITGKNFAFRIIVEVITGAWLALALVDAQYRPRRSWVLAALSVFVIAIAVADAQGAHPFKSFWSNFERMDGWITIAHLLLYFIVSVSIVNTDKLWRAVWHSWLIASVFLGIYGLLQVAGIRALGQPGSAGLSARVDATLGNPIYLAVYMLFTIFMAAVLWVRSRTEGRPGDRMLWSFAYGSVIILDTLVLFFTGTRGTILGLVGGALLAIILFALQVESRKVRMTAIGSVIGLFALAGIIVAAKDTTFVHKVGFIERLSTISITDGTIKSRFLNMGIAWQGVKERPIFGWGQENYAIVFDKYYDPRMYAQEPWFDRVHDIIFDWLIAGGFVGLLTYLSIFAAALWALWRGTGFSTAERSIITGLLAGYFFHNLTVFDNVTSYILFGTTLAYIAWRASESAQSPRLLVNSSLAPSTLIFTAIAAVPIVWASAWVLNVPAINQNHLLIQAISPKADINQNLTYFKQTADIGSLGTQEVREQLAQAAAQIASATNIPNDAKQKFFTLAVDEMTKQAQASPLDARFPLFLGLIFDSYGDYADAKVALQKAHDLSPRKQSIIYEQGMNAQARGADDESIALFKQAYELLPEDFEARMFYAAALIRGKQDAAADEVLAPAIKDGSAADSRIAAAYAARNMYGKIAAIWEAHVVAQPTDSNGYFTLAAAYYAAGQGNKAIQVLKDIEAKRPDSAAQAESLIKQIQDGTAKIK